MADSTKAQIGSQVTLAYWGVSSPPVWTNLGPIRSLGPIGASRPEVDSTTLDSTAVERILGLRDGKAVTVVFTVGATILPILEAIFNNAIAADLRVTIPSPTSVSRYFTIMPTDFEIGAITPNGLVECTLTGRITNTITSVASH